MAGEDKTGLIIRKSRELVQNTRELTALTPREQVLVEAVLNLGLSVEHLAAELGRA
jgi:hypothetical protein